MLKVEVNPTPAFYSFVAATALSLVLGHVASEYHRHGVRQQRRNEEAVQMGTRVVPETDWARAAPLCNFSTRRTRWALSIVLLTTFILALLASFMYSFAFNMGGLAAEVLDVGDKLYSLLSVATALPNAAQGHGLAALEALFLLLTMVLPLVLMITLLVLWLAPLPPRVQDILIYVIHVMDCWASMDVAALTLTIEAMELDHLTEFLVKSNGLARPCRIIKDLTAEECFTVGIDLHAGFVMLILAGIAMVVVPKVAHRACVAAVANRNAADKRSLATEDKEEVAAAGSDRANCTTEPQVPLAEAPAPSGGVMDSL